MNNNHGNTNASAQRNRLRIGQLDTITAHSELSILMPAARVKELRDSGHDMRGHLISLTDKQGISHHDIALNYLTQIGK